MEIREKIEKFELYILSLWLLFFLMIIITVDIPICLGNNCEFIGLQKAITRNIIPLIALTFILSGTMYYFRFNYKISGSKSLPVRIDSIEDANYEHLTFLTTYIIPLICFNFSNTRYLIAFFILLIVIGIIYVRTNKFYTNPTLALLGFRLYTTNITTRTESKSNIVLITKDKLTLGDKIRYQKLDDKVYFARKAQ